MTSPGRLQSSRREAGLHKWTTWLREDLGSRPYAWLRPDFVPPSPFLIVKDPQSQVSRILVEPHLVDAEFRKAWMPFFCRSGHPVVTPDQFLDLVGHLLPQKPYLDLSRITGRDLQELVVWMGGLGMRLRLFHFSWFSGLAILLVLVESTGVWPQGSLDAFFFCYDPQS